MKRIYESIIEDHFSRNGEMLFISGARQVGKTTTAREVLGDGEYLNWDIQEDRLAIIQGQRQLDERLPAVPQQMVVFDEMHKYSDWKNFIKGFYDLHQARRWKILVTGSAQLDTFIKGGDSLLGRYFHLQMFPLSAGELVRTEFTEDPISFPVKPEEDSWDALLKFGGFPQPLQKANSRFYRQWSRTRRDRLFTEDIRTLGTGYDVSKIELLSELITLNAATSLNYSSYSRMVRASVESIQRWIVLLEQLSYCFTVRPWTKNISRSIIKEPKIYLTDWAGVSEEGKRNENFVACSLLKAVSCWNETGIGDFGLYYIRTKEKREVDFLLTRDAQPWALVEVKTSAKTISSQLEYFQNMIGAQHALHVVIDMPYKEVDCFSYEVPAVVPARTFLTQLV
jgi:uncharacterized protein